MRVLEGLGVAVLAAGVYGLPGLFLATRNWVDADSSPARLAHHVAPMPAPIPARPVAALLPAPAARTPTPVPGEKLILVNLRARPQTLVCYDGSEPVMRFRVSGSRMGTDDVGFCKVGRKARRQWYAPDRYWMQYWMTLQPLSPDGRKRARLRGLNGIHATPPGNYRRLGGPASHGCVRMRLADARTVWAWARVGTPVYFYRTREQQDELALLSSERFSARRLAYGAPVSMEPSEPPSRQERQERVQE